MLRTEIQVIENIRRAEPVLSLPKGYIPGSNTNTNACNGILSLHQNL
jgi:hypothetical protein